MQCIKCGYSLWNLRGRQCPECSQAYRPSDYYFRLGKVEFCCPHCQHAYLGQGHKGHPKPIERDCESCGQHIHMDDMLVRPLDMNERASIEAIANPWVNREEIGFLSALTRTAYLSTIKPNALMQGTPRADCHTHALKYGAIVLGAFILSKAAGLFVLSQLLTNSQHYVGPQDAWGLLRHYLSIVLLPAGGILVYLTMQCLVTQAVLMLLERRYDGFDRTLAAHAYSLSPLLVISIPFCDVGCFASAMMLPCTLIIPLLAVFWCYCLASINVMRLHGISDTPAIFAVWAWPFTLIVGTIGWFLITINL